MFDLGPSYVPLPPELADVKVRLRPPRFSDYRAWQALREDLSGKVFVDVRRLLG